MPRPIFGSYEAQRRARRILPRIVFDYVEGGAGGEWTHRDNAAAFGAVELAPQMGVAAVAPRLATTVLGQPVAAPLLLSPVGGAGLIHPDGQKGASRAAGARGLIAAVSTFCGAELADVAQPAGPRSWFQLYKIGGRRGAEFVLGQAARGRYSALVVTIDTPVVGKKERELRHLGTRKGGVSLQQIDPATIAFFAPRVASKLRWSLRFAKAGFPVGNPTLARMPVDIAPTFTDAYVQWQREPFVWADLEWIRRFWDSPVVVKGVITAADARKAADLGVDGVVVSNHGGRQLDGVPAGIRALPSVAAEVGGDVEVILDGGVRRGTDIAKALALGATAVMIGRPWVYGLACSGETGVGQVLDHLVAELGEALTLLGCQDVAELSAGFVVGRS